MIGNRRIAALGGVLALALVLGACGSDNNCANPSAPGCTPASPTPSPTPAPVTTVLFSDSGPVPPESVGYIEFTIPSAGRIAAEVNWTFASSEVAIALTAGSCDDWERVFSGNCANIGNPNITRTQRPKTVAGSVSEGGSGRLWILNLSTVDESMAAQITHTTGGSSAALAIQSAGGRWVAVPGVSAEAVRAVRNRQ